MVITALQQSVPSFLRFLHPGTILCALQELLCFFYSSKAEIPTNSMNVTDNTKAEGKHICWTFLIDWSDDWLLCCALKRFWLFLRHGVLFGGPHCCNTYLAETEMIKWKFGPTRIQNLMCASESHHLCNTAIWGPATMILLTLLNCHFVKLSLT